MFKGVNVERAWKDRAYLESLSPEQRAQVPPNPVGLVSLTDMELEGVAGGTGTGAGCVSCEATKTGTTVAGTCLCDLSCGVTPADPPVSCEES